VASTYQYELPAAAQGVVGVRCERTANKWVEVTAYRFDTFSSTTDYTSGKSIIILADLPAGSLVEVRYRKDPTPMTADADVFTTVTGLPESCRDVAVLGAAWRLLSTVDSANLDKLSISAADLDSRVPPGVGSTIAKTIYQMFSLRLSEERRKLLLRYPQRAHQIGV